MKQLGVTRNFWTVLITILVIGLLFTYYLMVYVKDRERLIYEKKFRELDRIVQNVNEYATEIKNSLQFEVRTVKKLEAQRSKNQTEIDKVSSAGNPREETDEDLNLLHKMADDLSDLINSKREHFSDSAIQPSLRDVVLKFDTVWIKYNLADSLSKTIFKNASSKFFAIRIQHLHATSDILDSNDDGHKERSHETSARHSNAGIIFQNLQSEVRLEIVDSLVYNKRGLNWAGISDVKLDNTDYKLFTHWIAIGENDDILICALEKVSSIKSAAYGVETWIIINLICTVLLLLLAMPLLKLMIMNEVERLQINNVFFTGVSIILGSSVIMLFLNLSNHYFGYQYDGMDTALKEVSNAMKSNFTEEVNSIRKQLSFLRGKRAHFPEQVVYDNSLRDKKVNELVKKYKLYNEIVWIDAEGEILTMLSSNKFDRKDKLVPNVSRRKYFRAVQESNLWKGTYDTKNKELPPFYIDFVRSLINGQYQAVLSIPMDSAGPVSALALSTKLFSMQYSNLPPWYEACILDDRGEVMFHSTTSRSLQENFLDETDNNYELIAAMSGRIEDHVSVTYDRQQYRAYIQPIDGTPLYLVVFYPLDKYKVPMILTVWFSFGLVVLLFCFIALHLLILFGITYKPTKLKIRRFFLAWLRPRKPTVFRYKYLQSVTGGSMLFVFNLIVILFFPVSKETVAGVLVSPIFLHVFHYSLYASNDVIENETNRAKNVRTFQYWSIGFVILIDLVCCYLFGINFETVWVLLFQLAQVFILFLPFTSIFAKLNIFILPDVGYKKLYLYSTVIWLALVGIIPVFCFYKYSYEEESTIWTKHMQLEAVKSYFNRERFVRTQLSTFNADEILHYGNYQNATGMIKISSFENWPSHYNQPTNYEHLLFEFIPPLDLLVKESAAQVYSASKDTAWYWTQRCDSIQLNYKSQYTELGNAAAVTPLLKYQFDQGKHAAVFWIAIVGSCALTYRTIRFGLRNIYGFDIIKPINEVKISADFFRIKENTNKNFCLIGVPYSGKGSILNGLINNSKSVLRINLQTVLSKGANDTIKEKSKEENSEKQEANAWEPEYNGEAIVIIEHFEFGLNNHELNKKRLKLLQEFQSRPQAHVILSSAVQPKVILDYYDRMESLTDHLKEKEEFKDRYFEYKHAKRYWRSVLSGYIITYVPLSTDMDLGDDDLKNCELAYGTFLPKLRTHVANQPVETYTEREDFILKIEEMAEVYYHSLWNSFSKVEKRLLYDLALDRFVNVKNIATIRILLQKGVLVIRDSLQIFNKSFNNFILSAVNEDEEMMMQQEMRKKGSWNSVQLVLILVFLGIAMFISFAQRDILQNLNALITAIGGITALALRFGGLFTTGNKPKE